MVIAILIIIIIVLVYKYKKSNYRLEYDAWTFFEGTLGSGKTTIMTRLAINERRRRIIRNKLAPILNLILHILPIIHLFIISGHIKHNKKHNITKKKIYEYPIMKKGTDIYSNYPIRINKKLWSYAVNKDLLNWLFRVNQDSIIVLDEVAYLFPSEMKKTDPLYDFCMTWFRHGTNGLVFSASQSLSQCNKSFRSKVNRVYHLSGMKPCAFPFGFMFSKVQVRQAIISEDMNNEYVDNQETRSENYYRFKYPSTHFESRYGKNYYKLDQNDIIKLSTSYQETFNKLKIKSGSKWTSYYYEFN